MSGLFSTFNIATRGMAAQQKAIGVTTHNIANANTEGYSRQRVIMETTRPFGMPTLNNAAEPGQLGTGSQVSAIQRVRDSFLDYQVRVETSTQGQYSARDAFLSEIESIFNEPSDTGISTLVGKFFDSWQQLSKQPQSSNARTVVAQQSAALADALNHTAVQLDKLKTNTQSVIKETVFQVNDILGQLDQLNQQIIGVRVAGNMPNDLMDKRDLLLDELSSKFNINIDKKNFDGSDVKPVDEGGLANACLVKSENNSEVRRFSYVSNIKKTSGPAGEYEVTYYKNGDMTSDANKVTLIVNGMDEAKFRELDENRVLWADKNGNSIGGTVDQNGGIITASPVAFSDLKLFKPSSGELKGYMSVQQDIDDYNDQLNRVAKALAFSVNAVHSGKTDAANDKMPFFVNSDKALYDANNKMSNVPQILDAEDEITARNISVNKEVLNNVMQIKTRTNDNLFDYEKDNNLDGETDGARALAIAQIRDKLMVIQNIDSTTNRNDLTGSLLTDANMMNLSSDTNGMKLDNYFKDVIDKLGVQGQEAKRMVKNQDSLLTSFKETRESVSGVSIDEEMANLIQFQHAYQANAKIISTVDELLDVVVNGLKR